MCPEPCATPKGVDGHHSPDAEERARTFIECSSAEAFRCSLPPLTLVVGYPIAAQRGVELQRVVFVEFKVPSAVSRSCHAGRTHAP